MIGGEALATIGTHGLIGDMAFVTAGLMFATFGMLLRLWQITPMRAVAVTSVLALLDLPVHWLTFGFERMIALGLLQNVLQALAQG
ncbi:MAG: EamA/RhaT family transporter, partial [Alphaproteobacteria bacterium]